MRLPKKNGDQRIRKRKLKKRERKKRNFKLYYSSLLRTVHILSIFFNFWSFWICSPRHLFKFQSTPMPFKFPLRHFLFQNQVRERAFETNFKKKEQSFTHTPTPTHPHTLKERGREALKWMEKFFWSCVGEGGGKLKSWNGGWLFSLFAFFLLFNIDCRALSPSKS